MKTDDYTKFYEFILRNIRTSNVYIDLITYMATIHIEMCIKHTLHTSVQITRNAYLHLSISNKSTINLYLKKNQIFVYYSKMYTYV